jgi:thioredoxin 1
MIAPTFESLAKAHTRPGKIAFVKVDVDSQQAVAQKYGVRSMPTFLIFHHGKVVQTVTGANPPALTAAVDKAVKLAGAPGPSFSSGGQRLGGSTLAVPGRQTGLARPMAWDLRKIVDAIVTFFGLYFVSLFSFDPYKAAEKSGFNKKAAPRPQGAPGAGAKGGTTRPAFKTLADLGGD